MTDKKKFIFSNLLSLVLGIGIGAGGFGIVNNVNKQVKVPEQAVILPDNGGAVIGESQGNGIRVLSNKIAVEDYDLYGVSTQAESAYNLTATVYPENATNSVVNWSVAFKNASSSWANGKTVGDYVELSATTGSTVTVTNKKAFGEQIIITATSDDNAQAKATCTVDYIKRLTAVKMALSDGTELKTESEITASYSPTDSSTFAPSVVFDFESSDKLTFVPTFTQSDGTIDGGYSILSAVMNIRPVFLTNKAVAGILPIDDFHVKYYSSAGTTSLTDTHSLDVKDGVAFNRATFENFFGDLSTNEENVKYFNQFFSFKPSQTYMQIKNAFCHLGEGFFYFDITITSSRSASDGKAISYNYQYPVMVDGSSIEVSVESVNMDKSGLLY